MSKMLLPVFQPLPLEISELVVDTIPYRMLQKYAMHTLLDSVDSIRTFIQQIIPIEDISSLKPPLHIRGGHKTWKDALYSNIIFYIIMNEGDRRYEIAKARKLSTNQRRQYDSNIAYLHANRLYLNGRLTTVPKEVFISRYECSGAPLFNSDGDEIDVVDGTTCKQCGFRLTTKVRKSEQYQKKRRLNPDINCLTCCIGIEQSEKKRVKTNNLQETFYNQVKQPRRINEHRHIKFIDSDIESFLSNEFGGSIAQHLLPLVNIGTSIKVITLPTLTPKDQYHNRVKELNGAECFFDCLHAHPNVVKGSKLFDATIVLFDSVRNRDNDRNFFAIFNNDGYDIEDLYEYQVSEEFDIYAGKTFVRASSSAGIPMPDDKFSNRETISDDSSATFMNNTSTGAYFDATYITKKSSKKSGKVNKIGGQVGGYKDSIGTHWKKDDKKKLAEQSPSYRNMLLKEAIVFIKSMACICACDIPPSNVNKKYMNRLQTLLHKNVDRLNKGGIEELLIEYMYDFEEYRNHASVACHTDGNKDCNYEILSVIDRLRCNTQYAYLYFPLDNVVLEYVVNKSIVVANLSKTMHCADPTRGRSGSGGDGGNTSRASWRSRG